MSSVGILREVHARQVIKRGLIRPFQCREVLADHPRIADGIKLVGSIRPKENQAKDNDYPNPEDHASDVRTISN